MIDQLLFYLSFWKYHVLSSLNIYDKFRISILIAGTFDIEGSNVVPTLPMVSVPIAPYQSSAYAVVQDRWWPTDWIKELKEYSIHF